MHPPDGVRRRHDRLASRSEVADFLGVPVATLVRWAYTRTGPPYKIIGRHARYRWADVEAWLAQKESGGGAA
jgi:excisionase family DNA binding protein